jgi:hypothetical protein
MQQRTRLLVTTLALVWPLSACDTSPAPGPAKPVAAPVSAAPATPAAPSTAAAGAKPDTSGAGPQTIAATTQTPPAPAAAIKYEARGRRDPFAPLETLEGTKTAAVAAAKLRGIIRGGSGPIALVDTADGVGYILKQGDTLADGRLVEIGQDSVVFAVVPRAGAAANRVILTLPTN